VKAIIFKWCKKQREKLKELSDTARRQTIKRKVREETKKLRKLLDEQKLKRQPGDGEVDEQKLLQAYTDIFTAVAESYGVRSNEFVLEGKAEQEYYLRAQLGNSLRSQCDSDSDSDSDRPNEAAIEEIMEIVRAVTEPSKLRLNSLRRVIQEMVRRVIEVVRLRKELLPSLCGNDIVLPPILSFAAAYFWPVVVQSEENHEHENHPYQVFLRGEEKLVDDLLRLVTDDLMAEEVS
jgi:hypothetical protein